MQWVGGRGWHVFEVKLTGEEDNFDNFRGKLGVPFNNDAQLTLMLWDRFWAFHQRDPKMHIDKVLPDLSNVVRRPSERDEYFVLLIG
ncbi:hypothetical protein WJX72_001025 [[Myrmecia] bisecta]|uniref:Uncharacterized protein n=1 Tax=[Myrmecia] bisecta TaxID=41462 RepID=A0AAW1PP03_9CHLO